MGDQPALIKSERNSSLELLRILAMLGIVILHYNNDSFGGALLYVHYASVNRYYLILTECISVCSIDLFIMISAYFLSATNKRRLSKAVELFVQMILIRFAVYLIRTIAAGRSITLIGFIRNISTVYYFVFLYSALYLFSPLINHLFERFDEKKWDIMLLIVILGFAGWSFAVNYSEDFIRNLHPVYGNKILYLIRYGCTMFNFLTVYFFGSCIRAIKIKPGLKKSLLYTVIMITMLIIFTLVSLKIGFGLSIWNYNFLWVTFSSAAVLLLFLNIDIRSKVINEIAKGSFTCFIIQVYLLDLFSVYEYVNKSYYVLVIHQFITAGAIYLISYAVYKVYSLCTGWLFKKISPLIDRLDISL